jgi:hypothetical protein
MEGKMSEKESVINKSELPNSLKEFLALIFEKSLILLEPSPGVIQHTAALGEERFRVVLSSTVSEEDFLKNIHAYFGLKGFIIDYDGSDQQNFFIEKEMMYVVVITFARSISLDALITVEQLG